GSGNEKTEKTFVIVVSPNGSPSIPNYPHAGLICHLSKRSVTIISIQAGLGRAVRRYWTIRTTGDIHIDVTVVVVIAPRDASANGSDGDSGLRSHVGEGSIVIIVKQRIRRLRNQTAETSNHDIHVAIVVVVSPGTVV